MPVDQVAFGIPGYCDVIETPMDLRTIYQGLERGRHQASKGRPLVLAHNGSFEAGTGNEDLKG